MFGSELGRVPWAKVTGSTREVGGTREAGVLERAVTGLDIGGFGELKEHANARTDGK
jgi:hypothetical protein